MTSLDTLLDAIKRKDAAAVTRALDAEPGLIKARTVAGQTAAIVAIYWRAPAMLALLRARGAQLDVFEAAGAGDAERVDADHRELVSTIDKAVKRGALHRNTGARKKSRAARLLRGDDAA